MQHGPDRIRSGPCDVRRLCDSTRSAAFRVILHVALIDALRRNRDAPVDPHPDHVGVLSGLAEEMRADPRHFSSRFLETLRLVIRGRRGYRSPSFRQSWTLVLSVGRTALAE